MSNVERKKYNGVVFPRTTNNEKKFKPYIILELKTQLLKNLIRYRNNTSTNIDSVL